MLYKLNSFPFNNIQILLFITKSVLTFFPRCDMLIMLGRLSEPRVFLHICTLFPHLLSSFTWKRYEILKLLANCFLDAFFAPCYNKSVIFEPLMTDGFSGAPHGVRANKADRLGTLILSSRTSAPFLFCILS